MVELVLALGLAAMGAAGLGSFSDRMHWLEKEARSRIVLEHELRLNLQSVGNVLRCVPESTLAGFDAYDSTTRPEFERVMEGASGQRTLGGPALLEWRAVSGPVEGIAYPGKVVLVEGASERTVARRVPMGGLLVVRQGDALEIELTTYADGPDPDTSIQATGKIVVHLRN